MSHHCKGGSAVFCNCSGESHLFRVAAVCAGALSKLVNRQIGYAMDILHKEDNVQQVCVTLFRQHCERQRIVWSDCMASRSFDSLQTS